jgi:hypothetical protein
MQFHYQLDQRSLLLGLAPFFEQLPEDQPIHRVVSLLEVNEKVEFPFPLTVHFIKKATGVDGSGLAVLEASLVCLRRYKMWELLLDPLKYCFLHDLRNMRPHDYGSDLVQPTGPLGEGLLQGN